MSTELWLTFRTHLFDLEDFCTAYGKKLKLRNVNAKDNVDIVTQHITTKITDIKSLFPVLKLVTGEMFEKEHWAYMFSKVFDLYMNIYIF